MFLATLVRSTLGFGEALVDVPLLALLLPVKLAAPIEGAPAQRGLAGGVERARHPARVAPARAGAGGLGRRALHQRLEAEGFHRAVSWALCAVGLVLLAEALRA